MAALSFRRDPGPQPCMARRARLDEQILTGNAVRITFALGNPFRVPGFSQRRRRRQLLQNLAPVCKSLSDMAI